MGAGEQQGREASQYRLGRVLVAQGTERWGSEVSRWLAAAGFEPSSCEPRSALLAFDREQPDLVVLAAAPGPEEVLLACRWIRARSSVPVVVAVPRTAQIDVVQLLTSGADLVLPTSVGEQELVARVRALLRGRPPRRTSGDGVPSYGCLRLDRAHGLLEVAGAPLPLEDRQLQLMALLLQNAPGVTSRAAARDALKVDDSTLDGLVRRVRERLESVEGWRRIIAIRRVGFRLLADRPARGEADTVVRLDPAPRPTAVVRLDPPGQPMTDARPVPAATQQDASGLALA